MKSFYFKIKNERKKTIYHAALNDGKYEISWDGKKNRTSYKEESVIRKISNNFWIIIHDEIEAEDF